MKQNPFLDETWMPKYDAMTPALFEAAMAEALPAAERAFAGVEKRLDISWQGLIVAPNEAVRAPFEAWGTLCHLTSVVNSPEWRAQEEKWQPAIIALSQRVSQSKPLYEALLSLREGGGLEPWQEHVLDRQIQGMRQAGVGLPAAKRKAFNTLQTKLAKLSMTFSNNVMDAEKEARVEIAADEAEGIPADLLQGKAPWKLGVDFATYDAVMRQAECPAVRERFWRARISRGAVAPHDNTAAMNKILDLRRQEAEMLGYADYAHLSTAVKMAGDPQAVLDLLAPMAEVGKPAAKAEDAALAAFAKARGHKGKLQPWDKSYWAEKLSQETFGYDEEALRRYFPMERVLDGLFALVQDLFGVRIERQTGALHAWHKDVRFYRIFEGETLIAGLYFDPYARPGTKNGGAWMNEIRGRDFETRKRLPIAVVCCNQKPPRGKAPATMSFYEVATLFHEVGHALQETLTRIDSPTCAGIANVEWDAVEIASQFLEQFPYEPALLRSLSCHVETGKALPPDLAKRVVAKRTYRAGSALVRQLLFAETDLALHAKGFPRKGDTPLALMRRIGKRLVPGGLHEDDRFLNAFTHIFAGGYAAGYYSYKWSETLSADIYIQFRGATAAQRRKLGRKVRETLFALGGAQPAAQTFRDLMGRDPDPNAILRLEGLMD